MISLLKKDRIGAQVGESLTWKAQLVEFCCQFKIWFIWIFLEFSREKKHVDDDGQGETNNFMSFHLFCFFVLSLSLSIYWSLHCFILSFQSWRPVYMPLRLLLWVTNIFYVMKKAKAIINFIIKIFTNSHSNKYE